MTSVPELIGLARRMQRAGANDTLKRVARRFSTHIGADSLDFPLLQEDIADSTRLTIAPARRESYGRDQRVIGIVCTPPSAGSGGHTTLFRMLSALEERGYRCILFLYDRHNGDLEQHTRVVREQWPQVSAEVRDVAEGLNGIDACIASSWESAHVIASRIDRGVPCLYFVQDFEPYFYPRGSLYALAEDSYRFGFTTIALGKMVAGELERIGVPSVLAPFGCDSDVYQLTNTGARTGVVFYARPGADRRGYLLARQALEQFHVRHPGHPIHLYGGAEGEWGIPVVRHGRLSPKALNELYNSSVAGLAMSFTNISLVAEEMLAAGAVPVVNDSPLARADLDNEYVLWAQPTPGGIADALSLAVERGDRDARACLAAGSVRQGWGPAGAIVCDVVAGVVGQPIDAVA